MQLKIRIYRKIFIQFIWRISYYKECVQILERLCTVRLYLTASDWCSLIIVTNAFFCIWFLRISSIHFSYSLSLKVNWVYSLQYLFYHLLHMVRAAFRIWIHRLFFQCPIFGVRNNIWDQTFCVIELPLQLESRVKHIEHGSSQAWIFISELC